MIEVKNLVKAFKVYKKQPGIMASLKGLFSREYTDVVAVNDVSISIAEGEMIGFIGMNGAGKTTTLKTLSGLLHPTSGHVSVLGYNPHDRDPEFLKQISLIMGQKSQLWWDLPAIESFALNKEIYEISDERYKEVLAELVEVLDLGDLIYQPVRKLSLGQRMKCELVAALIHTPKVLFLDEPTIGLDVVVQKNLREFIRFYNQKYNATVILTSHYMDDVKEVCERIIMIDSGRIVYDGAIGGLIDKYAGYKLLIPVFNKPVQESQLSEIGEVQEFNNLKAVIRVPRQEASARAALLLNNFDVDDIDINEPSLEDIVRTMFDQQ